MFQTTSNRRPWLRWFVDNENPARVCGIQKGGRAGSRENPHQGLGRISIRANTLGAVNVPDGDAREVLRPPGKMLPGPGGWLKVDARVVFGTSAPASRVVPGEAPREIGAQVFRVDAQEGARCPGRCSRGVPGRDWQVRGSG